MRFRTVPAALAGLFLSVTAMAAPVVQALPWEALKGWQQDSLVAVPQTFRQICAQWQAGTGAPRVRQSSAVPVGQASDWQPACAALPGDATVAANPATLRQYWETWFLPWLISDGSPGLFTGYYEIALQGSETRTAEYQYPVYGRPPDLVQIDNAAFGLPAGEHWGKVTPQGTLVRYPDRKTIEQQGVHPQTPVLYWLHSATDLFFLHVQGSGTVSLPDGRLERIGFAARNGHPYTAIGKVLIEKGALNKQNTSLQTIRAWLEANPQQAAAVMHQNASYIFFRKRDTSGPIGAMGIPLTAGRSLAVDPSILPYGVPLWLEVEPSDKFPQTFQRLVFAMDTGAAIRGTVRGDYFWGTGKEAELGAGQMANPGRYMVLLPKTVRP